MPGLPQTLRTNLRTAHCRPASSINGDTQLQPRKRTQLDRLYQRIADDLHQLLNAVGLKLAA